MILGRSRLTLGFNLPGSLGTLGIEITRSRRFWTTLLVLLFFQHCISAQAQDSDQVPVYMSREAVDYGGRIGIVVKESETDFRGSRALEVIELKNYSSANGAIKVGDFIVSVNGFSFRSVDDFPLIVSSGTPNSQLIFGYISGPQFNNLNFRAFRLAGGPEFGVLPGFQVAFRTAFRQADCAAWMNIQSSSALPNAALLNHDQKLTDMLQSMSQSAREGDILVNDLRGKYGANVDKMINNYFSIRRNSTCTTSIREHIDKESESALIQKQIAQMVRGH